MGRPGRPGSGSKLVDNLEGSPPAKRRLKLILETLSGECAVVDAAKELGCNEACFYALRQRTLQEALEGLEPRKRGRKPKQVDPKDERIAELTNELERVRGSLRTLDLRLELAAAGIGPAVSKKRRAR